MDHLRPDAARRAYEQIRSRSLELCEPLAVEDHVIQAASHVSPPKWHLAHTTWFFETFLLEPFVDDYRTFHPQYRSLFNSYYTSVGDMHPRANRGVLSRPTLDEVHTYRASIDEQIIRLIDRTGEDRWPEVAERIELGLNHEEQHQELLLMDVKFNFSQNPLLPAYRRSSAASQPTFPIDWSHFPGGLHEVGTSGPEFAFDNERPQHPSYLPEFELSNRLVTNAEYLEFVEDAGYRRPELWLADGWQTIQERNWTGPLYWMKRDGQWMEFTLGGIEPLSPEQAVVHVSYYEADAFARWSGHRLPSEVEWELATRAEHQPGEFLESGRLHPSAARSAALGQMLGDAWEWTQSPYQAYPGYQAPAGALGEYNGKFMCNQFVLRGGSCATPRRHIRTSYRNFYYPDQRWAFASFRLAKQA